VGRQLAVVVPEVHVTADPSFLTSVPCFQDVDLASAFFAGEFAHFSFAGDGRVVRLHRTQLSVAFSFVGGMTKNFASFTTVFGRRALAVSGLRSAATSEAALRPC